MHNQRDDASSEQYTDDYKDAYHNSQVAISALYYFQSRVHQLQTELQEKNTTISALQANLIQTNQQLKSLQLQYDQNTKVIVNQQDQIRELQQHLSQQQSEMTMLQSRQGIVTRQNTETETKCALLQKELEIVPILKSKISALEQQIENEKSINSRLQKDNKSLSTMNAHLLRSNKQLTQNVSGLSNAVSTMQVPPSPSAIPTEAPSTGITAEQPYLSSTKSSAQPIFSPHQVDRSPIPSSSTVTYSNPSSTSQNSSYLLHQQPQPMATSFHFPTSELSPLQPVGSLPADRAVPLTSSPGSSVLPVGGSINTSYVSTLPGQNGIHLLSPSHSVLPQSQTSSNSSSSSTSSRKRRTVHSSSSSSSSSSPAAAAAAETRHIPAFERLYAHKLEKDTFPQNGPEYTYSGRSVRTAFTKVLAALRSELADLRTQYESISHSVQHANNKLQRRNSRNSRKRPQSRKHNQADKQTDNYSGSGSERDEGMSDSDADLTGTGISGANNGEEDESGVDTAAVEHRTKELEQLSQQIGNKLKQIRELEKYHEKVTVAKAKCGQIYPYVAHPPKSAPTQKHPLLIHNKSRH